MDEQLEHITIGDMRFDGWRVIARPSNRGTQVQVRAYVTCADTGGTVVLSSHWRQIEPNATTQEILFIVRDAAINMVIHDLLENFRFKGIKCFDPHYIKGVSSD
jgi:hypothetical protein